jgi:serine/threonine protein kinase
MPPTPKVLGHGVGGQVYEAETPSGKKVAVKWFDFHNLASRRSFQIESAVFQQLKKLNSPRFAKAYAINQNADEGSIVMKLYDGDLFDYMNRSTVTERNFRLIFKSICRAIQKLHLAAIAHLDIKPENILMRGNYPVIADFGCCFVDDSPQGSTSIPSDYYSGTTFYSPPEAKRAQFINPYKVDIFSLGVLLHVVLTGLYPVCKLTGRCDLSYAQQYLTPGLYTLLKMMLSDSPSARPSIQEVLKYYNSLYRECK